MRRTLGILLEDRRRDKNLTDQERLTAADAVAVVNGQRNDLMDELDLFLEKALAGRTKLTQPKMKLY